MSRAHDTTSKVFYRGTSDDFIVFVDDIQAVQTWRKDRSLPLTDVVSGFNIFVTDTGGAQGVLNEASNAMLENEFGSSHEDDCIIKILENGDFQSLSGRQRNGNTNLSNGPAGVMN